MKSKKHRTQNNKTLRKKKTGMNDKGVRGLSGKKKGNKIRFADHPEFVPNLTPREMFKMGSFGGTYWRPIYSSVTKKRYRNVHRNYPSSWWSGIPDDYLVSENYDVKKNKYGVKVGTTLEFWESKKWITPYNPYGWVHWYCDFFSGKRSPDDARQIGRWQALAGKRGRFMRFLVTLIIKKDANYNDETVSPKIRQVLQHWGYELTKSDYENELARRNIT